MHQSTVAHILCPGPSLATHLPALRWMRAHTRQLVIAVNRAADALDHDWLAAGDRRAFGRDEAGNLVITQIASVGVITYASECRWIRDCGDPDIMRFAHLDLRQWEDLHPRPPELQWSLQAALILAQQLGARTIHLYGCDQTGTANWDGTTQDGRDEVARWQRERTHLAETLAILTATVIRH